MTKFVDIQNSFQRGMLSPKMRGRIDILEYKQGAEVIENALGFKQGGIYRRPGSEYLNTFEVPGAGSGVQARKIIPLGDEEYFLVINTSGKPVLMKYEGDTSSFGLEEQEMIDNPAFADAFSRKFLIGREYTGAFLDLSPWIVNDFITIGTTTIIARDNAPPVVIYPAQETVVSGPGSTTKFAYKCHLLAIDINAEKLAIINPVTDFLKSEAISTPYRNVNVDVTKTVRVSATTGLVVLYTNFRDIGNTGDYYKITIAGTTGVVRVIGQNASSPPPGEYRYDVKVIIPVLNTTTTATWQRSIKPYYKSVTLNEQRLVFGKDNVVYGSQTANIQRFAIEKLAQDTASDSSGLSYFGDPSSIDPYSFTISSGEPENITWLSSGEALEVGTDKNEYTISGSNGALSGQDVKIRLQTSYGSLNQSAIKTNKSTLIISKEGHYLRRYRRNLEGADSYEIFDLNLYSDNIVPNAKFKKVIHIAESSVIWVLTTANELLSCTYHEESDVVSWSKHTLGGVEYAIQDIASNVFRDGPPGLYITIRRKINNEYRYYFERIGLEFREDFLNRSVSDAAFSDCYIRKTIGSTSSMFTTIPGLDHLEGETVDVLANGILERGIVVTGGEVNLSGPGGSDFVIGMPYTTLIKTFPLEVGGQYGTSQSIKKRINEVTFKFYNSKGVTVSSADASNEYPLNFGDETVDELLTGDVRKKVSISPDFVNQFIIKQDKSLPMNLLAFITRGTSYD